MSHLQSLLVEFGYASADQDNTPTDLEQTAGLLLPAWDDIAADKLTLDGCTLVPRDMYAD